MHLPLDLSPVDTGRVARVRAEEFGIFRTLIVTFPCFFPVLFTQLTCVDGFVRDLILGAIRHCVFAAWSVSTFRTRWGFRDGMNGALHGDIVSGPAVQGPAGCKAPARCRNRPACGQAVASASRMRLAVSTTRAPIFRSFSRKVANSATANA